MKFFVPSIVFCSMFLFVGCGNFAEFHKRIPEACIALDKINETLDRVSESKEDQCTEEKVVADETQG